MWLQVAPAVEVLLLARNHIQEVLSLVQEFPLPEQALPSPIERFAWLFVPPLAAMQSGETIDAVNAGLSKDVRVLQRLALVHCIRACKGATSISEVLSALVVLPSPRVLSHAADRFLLVSVV